MGTYRIEEAPTVFAKRKSEFLRNASLIVQTAAHTFHEEVLAHTPFDTGHAISNWVAEEGSAFSGEEGAYGVVVYPSPDAAEAAARAHSESVIKSFQAVEGAVLYISNNVRYIGFLNDPSTTNKPSASAIPGFVQLAIQAALLSVTGRKVFVEGGP